MVCIFTCWTCKRRLDPETTIEEFFFWCNKDCYDKDDRYHNREKVIDTKPTIADADHEDEKKQRKAKIRAALAKINGSHKD